MLGVGFPELVVIFVVGLIVLGPERLPQVARQLARWVHEVRKAADELKRELGAEEVEKSKEELEKVRKELLNKVYNPLPEIEEKEISTEKSKTPPDERTP